MVSDSRVKSVGNRPHIGAVSEADVPAHDNWRCGRFLLALLMFLPALASIATAAIIHWGTYFDDAFISFRYAKNLANGYGLTWNPGSAPTEGYTNFLLVFALAPAISVGISPLVLTRIVSLIALFGVAGMLYALSRRYYGLSSFSAAVVACFFLISEGSESIWLTGLETNIYSLFFMLAVVSGMALIRWRQRSWAILAGLVLLVAMLLRPEAILIYPAVVLAYFLPASRANRFSLIPLVIYTSVPLVLGLIYLVWKYWYFGSILPNPFYIKASSNQLFSPVGLRSVAEFLENSIIWLIFLVMSAIMTFRRRGSIGDGNARGTQFVLPSNLMICGFLIIIGYASFFARTETLMDIDNRFLYPLVPLVLFLGVPSIGVFVSVVAQKLRVVLSGPIKASFATLLMLCLLPFHVNPIKSVGKVLEGTASVENTLMQKEYRVAIDLSAFPDIESTKIAFGDSGVIPFFTNSIWLDTVGLNDSFIARNRDIDKLKQYFFEWGADLVILPGDVHGSWITYGHGPLGNYQSWVKDGRWDRYEYVGSVLTKGTIYDLQFFVQKESPVANLLAQFLKSCVVDGWYSPFPLEIGSYSPNDNKSIQWVERDVPGLNESAVRLDCIGL